MIRVTLPTNLRTLANVTGEVHLDVEQPVTQERILDALEDRYPMLKGTIRDRTSKARRPFVRFFACEEDPRTNQLTLHYRPRSSTAASYS